MGDWRLNVGLGRNETLPVFLRIARAISADIRRGRLRPNDRLPGSRALAKSLRVHRNTVLSAYAELQAEGWVTTEQARGTFVSKQIPETRPRGAAIGTEPAQHAGYSLGRCRAPDRAAGTAFELRRAPLSLAGGLPDMGLVPSQALARAYRRQLKRHGATHLDYGDQWGHPRLREAITGMLGATRGLVLNPNGLLITRGSQMAIYLIAQTLIRPGDVVAVESYGYRPAWQALRLAGAELVSVPVDKGGMRIDRLAEIAATRPLRAVYLTAHHQYPTTVCLSPGRRLALLELARRSRFAIIEDDYDHEFHYDGRPVLPLASADPAGVVLYVGTLSKVLAPGLRIGYVAGPPPVIERLASYRSFVDHHGDQAVEAAVAELIEDGELQRHVGRARRIYRKKRDTLVELLTRHLGDRVTFSTPPGGLALWARIAPAIDVNAWADRAGTAGVAFDPADRFQFDRKRRPYARFGFGRLDETQLAKAVQTIAAVA